MKFIKRPILAILVLMTVGLLSRGRVYRHLVTYKSVGLRQNYVATNEKLVDYIEIKVGDKKGCDIKNIIKLGLSATSQQLRYTVDSNNNDPNKLINSRTAHCVGYASFFATTCNYLLRKLNMADQWIAKPQIGQLYFLGINVHNYFDSAFFKDHDFVTIENKTAGEIYAVDPTVHDYFFIDFVTYTK